MILSKFVFFPSVKSLINSTREFILKLRITIFTTMYDTVYIVRMRTCTRPSKRLATSTSLSTVNVSSQELSAIPKRPCLEALQLAVDLHDRIDSALVGFLLLSGFDYAK